MAQTFRVSLSGYNALTDTDPNHFALYADGDNVLIKEKTRGSQSVNGSSSVNIAHGIGDTPLCLVFVETSSGVFRKLFSHPLDGAGYWYEVNSTNLELHNSTGSAKTFYYYIFYDDIT